MKSVDDEVKKILYFFLSVRVNGSLCLGYANKAVISFCTFGSFYFGNE